MKQKIGIGVLIIIMLVLLALIVLYLAHKKSLVMPKEVADVYWVNEQKDHGERIYFGSDGKFIYETLEGKAINYSDSCKKYEYDRENDMIRLTCEDGISFDDIEIISYDKKSLVLDLPDGQRQFHIKEQK